MIALKVLSRQEKGNSNKTSKMCADESAFAQCLRLVLQHNAKREKYRIL